MYKIFVKVSLLVVAQTLDLSLSVNAKEITTTVSM